MLPSTGYFNGINCPFYENGLCDRPYCHFRHVKKTLQNTANEGIESGSISQKILSVTGQNIGASDSLSAQHLVVDNPTNSNNGIAGQFASKATYNPTPISELNKINNSDAENVEDINGLPRRHIPVTHTPSKPVSLPIKRPSDTSSTTKFIYIPPPQEYNPGSLEHISTDKYTPTSASHDSSGRRNYVPSSDKNHSKKKILEYEPTKLSMKAKPSVTYQPTPRSLAPYFSSDEEEPDNKKRKLSNDLNILDDLEPELDMVGEIIDDEKTPEVTEIKIKNDIGNEVKDPKYNKSTKDNKNDNILHKVKEKNHKSHHKSKLERKDEKNKITEDKHKKDKQSQKKSSHKSSNKDKDKQRTHSKDRLNSKDSTDRKKHTSKGSRDRSKNSKDSSSKKSERHSSSKSKEKSRKEKSHKNSKRDKSKKLSEDRFSDFEDNMNEENGHDNDSIVMNDSGLSDTDEETIAEECKKIFEEYEPEKPKLPEEIMMIEETVEEEYIPGKKRVSRTQDKNIKVTRKAPLKPDFKVSAAQAMNERLAKVREFHNSRQTPISSITSNDNSKTASGSKVRIAYVPYASTLLKAKKTMPPPQPVVQNQPSTSFTVSQTLVKGQQRLAHVPSEKFIDRPGVLEPLASKIPANARSLYLNKMIDECLKLYISSTDAYARAQHEELNTSKKCSTIQIYKNSASVTVGRLRKEIQESNGIKKSNSDCTVLGKGPTAGTWSIEKKKVINNSHEFVGARLYSNILKWVLTEEQLKDNGFPRQHQSGVKGRAIIHGQNKQKPPQGFIRTCCRCKKDYKVNKEGLPVRNEECIYHPNNKYRVRGEARYQCCSQDATADGCCVAPNHVYEYVDFENLKGYVQTLIPEKELEDYGVYSLDCEMCYTTHGLDLTRVTVIDSSCKVIYETLVRPSKPIIDYNTRYSGITKEQMTNVKTTLLEVQATLLAMFSSKTILVGHSLESDFKALKLIHDTVIDTSVLFPHKMGPPFKRALRNLSSEHLKKIIQNSVDGHDSAEDAMVCMELLHYKLKEDLKSR